MRDLGSTTLAAALLVFSLEAHAQPLLRGLGPPPRGVVVTNFPNPQNVTGSVAVTNLPAVQDVNVVSAPPAGGASPRFQLVGFTTATFTGGQGVLGFTLACQQEFADSRMCTSLEILETTKVPGGLAGEAWVRPTITTDLPTAGTVVDASGVSAVPDFLSCDGWRDNGSTPFSNGLVVDGAGRFRSRFTTLFTECGVARAVACCAPVP
jgi:hypothetical protein